MSATSENPIGQGWLALRLATPSPESFHVWMIPPSVAEPLFSSLGSLARASHIDWPQTWLSALAHGLTKACDQYIEQDLGNSVGTHLYVDTYDSYYAGQHQFFLRDPSSVPQWVGIRMTSGARAPGFGPGKTFRWVDQRLREELPDLPPTLGPFRRIEWDRWDQVHRGEFLADLARQTHAAMQANELAQQCAAPASQSKKSAL